MYVCLYESVCMCVCDQDIFYFLKTLMFTIVVSLFAWVSCNILDVWYFAFLLFIIIIIISKYVYLICMHLNKLLKAAHKTLSTILLFQINYMYLNFMLVNQLRCNTFSVQVECLLNI